MSDPDALRSIFEDHSDLEMDNLTSPIPSSEWNSQFGQFDHSRLLTTAVPIMALPLILSLLLRYPLWFPSFLHLHPIILPSLPLFQLTHYSLHVYNLKDHIMWRRHHGSREGNTLYQVEDRNDIYYWITCCMDHTGVEFSMRVGWDLVIDPNPQDMLSRLARVGSLMWLWWGHLSELVQWS